MRLLLLLIIVLCFLLGSGIAWFIHAPNAIFPGMYTRAETLIGGPFRLISTSGTGITEKSYQGKLRIVYFCYTNSPDICPAGLQVISEVLRQLEKHGNEIATLFISFDPERDTPEKLKEFLHNYHPGITGLTGSVEAVRSAAEAYRVYFSKVKPDTGPGSYLIRHTTQIYLMDRNGKYLAHFNYGQSPASIVKTIVKYL